MQKEGWQLAERPKYKRILLKLSGEALAGKKGTGLDFTVIRSVCEAIRRSRESGVEIGIVVGGGNFWRGARDVGWPMDRSRADQIGMLATVMNGIALSDVLEQLGVPCVVQTAVEMQRFAEPYSRRAVEAHFHHGEVIIFGCGTGHPFFSTDTGAVLRALEIGADAILLAKNIDGVYSADPKVDPSAVRYDTISYEDVLAKKLRVIDATAASLAMERRIPLLVFALSDPENILRVLAGEPLGTIVH